MAKHVLAALALGTTLVPALHAQQPAPTTREVSLDVRDRLGRTVASVSACRLAEAGCDVLALRAENGRWAATLAPGPVRLRLSAPGFAARDVEVPDPWPSPVVTLASKATVSARLASFDERNEQTMTATLLPVDDGRPTGRERPLEEKKVSVPASPARLPLAFDDVPPGSYLLGWNGARVARGERRFEVDAKGSSVDLGDLKLLAGLTVDGTVRDEFGGPLADAGVRVVEHGRLDGFMVAAKAGSDGSFVIAGIPLGLQLDWSASATGYESASGTWAGETRLEVSLKAAQRLFGVVVDEEGRPVPNARLSLVAQNKQGGGSQGLPKADAEGRFSAFRPKGRVQEKQGLRVQAEGLLPLLVELPESREPRELDLGTIRLSKGRTLSGRVTEAATGKPLEGAAVAVYVLPKPGVPGRQPDTGTSGADGSFEVSGLAKDEDVVVVARKAPWAPASRRVPSSAATGENVELALTRGGRLEVRVCGTPSDLRETHVLLRGPSEGLQTDLLVAEDGGLVFDGLEVGSYRVSTLWVHDQSGRGSFRTEGEDVKVVTVREGATASATLECDGILVAGVVLLGGLPLANAVGSLELGSPQGAKVLRTDEAGRFSVRVHAAGTYSAAIDFGVPPTPRGMRLTSGSCEVPVGGTSACTLQLAFVPEKEDLPRGADLRAGVSVPR